MPAGAFQYCEPMRIASSFGWHVYPPKDISLLFDGRETFLFEDGQWYPLKSYCFEDEFRSQWNALAPAELQDSDPPFLTELFVPGIVQIWSGYFVSTKPNWSLNIRAPANCERRSTFSTFEGIVETDKFRPCPLFVNLQLQKTDIEIFLSTERPLFQIQPVLRECYTLGCEHFTISEGLSDDCDWEGIGHTIRRAQDVNSQPVGRYAVEARKR